MPQEFQVLRCYQCSTFQVHQVKKAKKWNCKMCGEKQSVIKVFGRGTGADCRHHVQKLNSLRGEIEQVTLETATEPDNYQEQSEISQPQIGQDSAPSFDRWSRFVTIPQDEEEAAEGEQLDDRFTTDMAEFRQKQMTRKRKRNQKPDEYEDEFSEQSHFRNCHNLSSMNRRPLRVQNSPHTDDRERENADEPEFNTLIQLRRNKSHFQGRYPSTNSANLSQHYNGGRGQMSIQHHNRGQGQKSRWEQYGNEGNQYSHNTVKDQVLECQSGLLAGTNCGNYQDIKNVPTGQGHHQVMTEGQVLNRGQGHCNIQTEGQGIHRNQGCHQVLTEVQSSNRSQGHHQVLTAGQYSNRNGGHQQDFTTCGSISRGHHDGMKKIQKTSKWSKYETELDSDEEDCNLVEKTEMDKLSEIFQNNRNTGDVLCEESKEGRNRENTVFDSSNDEGSIEGRNRENTVFDSSNDEGSIEGRNRENTVFDSSNDDRNFIHGEFIKRTSGKTSTRSDVTWKPRQGRMWTGGKSHPERENVYCMEGNDRQQKGDNSNSLIGVEEKQGKGYCQGEDGIIKSGASESLRKYGPGCSEDTCKSYVMEDKLRVELPTLSVKSCDKMKSNVFNSEPKIGYTGHLSRSLTQTSTVLQPVFVTDDITDEDLEL